LYSLSSAMSSYYYYPANDSHPTATQQDYYETHGIKNLNANAANQPRMSYL
jgi:hypothetical protein